MVAHHWNVDSWDHIINGLCGEYGQRLELDVG